MQWLDGTNNGGSPVIDYRVNIAGSDGVWSVLQANVLAQSYIAQGLTSGETYSFKIESRNAYGYSDHSDTLTVLVA